MAVSTDATRNGPYSSLSVGTTTNDNAPAGNLGEFVTSSVPVGSQVALSNGVTANMTSIVLTAGDWDLNVQTNFNAAAATFTDVRMGPSPTSASLATQTANGVVGTDALVISPLSVTTATGVYTLGNVDIRISTASTVTIYATAQVNGLSAGTVSVYGTIRARRVR